MIGFSSYAPDLPAFENASRYIKNVYPAARRPDGGVIYQPIRQPSSATDALSARCLGAVATSGDTVINFAGTASKLYMLEDRSWTSVGSGYTVGSDDRWDFAQFDNILIATNGTDAPLKWEIGSSSAFTALGGGPPTGKYLAVIRDFVFFGNTTTSKRQLLWSGINNAESYTASATTQADAQILPDGGSITGIVGGEYGVVLQQEAIRRISYVGSPLIFQVDKVDDQNGCRAPGSIAAISPAMIFYLGNDGFYMTDGNGPSKPIGTQRVDVTISDELDQSNLHRVTSVIDPDRKLYLCAIPTKGGNGMPTKIYAYNYEIGEWSVWEQSVDVLFVSRASSYTLEQLDTLLGLTNLDTMGISLDSSAFIGGAEVLASFGSDFTMSYFAGQTEQAIIETVETQLFPGRSATVYEVTPYVEGTDVTPSVKIGVRDSLQEVAVYNSAVDTNANGYAPVRTGTFGKYHRAQIIIPEGSTWSSAHGIDFKANPAGMR